MKTKWQVGAVFGVVFLVLGMALIGPMASYAQDDAKQHVYLPALGKRPTAPKQEPTPTPTPKPPSGFADRVIQLVNAERTAHGCSPLNTNPALTTAATKHTNDMANNDFFSHTGSDGSQPWDRMTAAGYQWSNAAENIAAGYTTPAEVVEGWMSSSGHRNNILNCNLKDTGVGYVYLANDPGDEQWQYYWTQVFGAPR